MKIRSYNDMAANKAKFQKALEALDGIQCRAASDLRAMLDAIADYELFGVDSKLGWERLYYAIENDFGLEIRTFGDGYLGTAFVGRNLSPSQKLLAYDVLGGNCPFDEWNTYLAFLKDLKEAVPPDFIDSKYENWYGWLPYRAQDVLDAFRALREKYMSEERKQKGRKRLRDLERQLQELRNEVGEQ